MYYTAKVGRPANELFSTERLNTLHLTRRSKIGRLVSFFTFSFLGMLACTGSAKFKRQRRQKLFSKELFLSVVFPWDPVSIFSSFIYGSSIWKLHTAVTLWKLCQLIRDSPTVAKRYLDKFSQCSWNDGKTFSRWFLQLCV